MFCQKCGKEIEEGSQFCPYCGARNAVEPEIRKQDVPASVKTDKVKKKRKRLPVIVLAVLVIMLLGVMLLSGDDSSSAGKEYVKVKDLALYADYTEDALVQELGYEKNEYGIYPADTHMNFFFKDGKMYMLMVNSPKDMGMSICGVSLQDSIEEAGAILESEGFRCEGSFESAELAKDGSLDTVEITVHSYVESKTGYSYYVSVDADGNITSLSYALEAEELIYTEGVLEDDESEYMKEALEAEEPAYMEETSEAEENSWNITAEALTYGAYSFDDGTGTTGTADVGFYTDMDGDYIYIECWRNDRAIVYFTGILEAVGESYYAYCEEIDTSIIVTFVDGGLYVQIDESTFADINCMEGFYNLDEVLNLNEVG